MRKLIILIAALFYIQSCQGQIDGLLGDDIRLFKGEAWKLAQAVKNQDVVKIKKIVEQGKVPVDYREPRFGKTLLIWSVLTDRYRSAEALLESGADPNLQDTYSGTSALMKAADKEETSDFVRLLLKYGGEPNRAAEKERYNWIGTPLIAAARNRLESVKLLVEAGADVNHITPHGGCALEAAFLRDQVEIVTYLLMEKGADFRRIFGERTDGSEIRVGDLLRRWTFPLESEHYREKMKIVDFLKERGVDYWQAPIPKHYFNIYPVEYLAKY